jgi:hypothetical protein
MRSGFIVLTFAIALSACRSNDSSPPKEDTARVTAAQAWTVVVPKEFKATDNGSSWQGYDTHRVVFLAAQTQVTAPTGPLASEDITPSSAWLGGDAPGEKIESKKREARGTAIIRTTDKGIELNGYMTNKGQVVVCTITADDARYKSWAADTWRSLMPTGDSTPAK